MNNRILVIDDDAQVIETYREILVPMVDEIDELATQIGLPVLEDENQRQFEFELMSATQGEEGVEFARMAVEMKRPFAVAMIDMRMPPGMDGLQTATELRKLDDRILIVIVTAYTDRSIEEIQKVLNHDAILVYKPFTGEEIFQMARTLCISWNDREEKQEAYREIERLATYPEENPSPILRFSAEGELLYCNPHSEGLLKMMEVAEVGEQLKGAWLKRIRLVYQGGQALYVEVAGKSIFYQLTLAPISDRGYINCYAQDITRRYLLNRQLTYQARHDRGEEPESLDKEFLRLWLREKGISDTNVPDLDDEIRLDVAERYIDLFERVTGQSFEASKADEPLRDAIERSIEPYFESV